MSRSRRTCRSLAWLVLGIRTVAVGEQASATDLRVSMLAPIHQSVQQAFPDDPLSRIAVVQEGRVLAPDGTGHSGQKCAYGYVVGGGILGGLAGLMVGGIVVFNANVGMQTGQEAILGFVLGGVVAGGVVGYFVGRAQCP